jgi:hypothetical protein
MIFEWLAELLGVRGAFVAEAIFFLGLAYAALRWVARTAAEIREPIGTGEGRLQLELPVRRSPAERAAEGEAIAEMRRMGVISDEVLVGLSPAERALMIAAVMPRLTGKGGVAAEAVAAEAVAAVETARSVPYPAAAQVAAAVAPSMATSSMRPGASATSQTRPFASPIRAVAAAPEAMPRVTEAEAITALHRMGAITDEALSAMSPAERAMLIDSVRRRLESQREGSGV